MGGDIGAFGDELAGEGSADVIGEGHGIGAGVLAVVDGLGGGGEGRVGAIVLAVRERDRLPAVEEAAHLLAVVLDHDLYLRPLPAERDRLGIAVGGGHEPHPGGDVIGDVVAAGRGVVGEGDAQVHPDLFTDPGAAAAGGGVRFLDRHLAGGCGAGLLGVAGIGNRGIEVPGDRLELGGGERLAAQKQALVPLGAQLKRALLALEHTPEHALVLGVGGRGVVGIEQHLQMGQALLRTGAVVVPLEEIAHERVRIRMPGQRGERQRGGGCLGLFVERAARQQVFELPFGFHLARQPLVERLRARVVAQAGHARAQPELLRGGEGFVLGKAGEVEQDRLVERRKPQIGHHPVVGAGGRVFQRLLQVDLCGGLVDQGRRGQQHPGGERGVRAGVGERAHPRPDLLDPVEPDVPPRPGFVLLKQAAVGGPREPRGGDDLGAFPVLP